MFTYGCIKDIEDIRDFVLDALHLATPPPASVDLRPNCPPVYDQGALGSCTANALSFLYQYDLLKNHDIDFLPSRLFLYFQERVLGGNVSDDTGARLRDGMKVLNSVGLAAEKWWPYVIGQFAVPPPGPAMVSAAHHKSIKYQSVPQDENQIKRVLASGQPVAFSFTVYESFESSAVAFSGMVPIPSNTDKVVGGHAVALVGYDDTDRTFLVRNSWGEEWGIQGYFRMPYSYVTDPGLASDLWVLNAITG
jgi:C1A family cysteine protease